MVTGTHTSTWFYCFGSLAAPRLSTPFPALSESHHPADGHPSPSHEVAHPLIRPSTPFGQTSTHRSRKPAPCPPALSLVRSLFLSSSVLPLVPSSPSFDHPRPDPPSPSSLQARTDTSNAPALSHRLSDTHARHCYRWDTSTYYTHTLVQCARARTRVHTDRHTHRYMHVHVRMRTVIRAPTSACTCTRLDVSIYDLS